jgi:carboxymethylenebutenolidase
LFYVLNEQTQLYFTLISIYDKANHLTREERVMYQTNDYEGILAETITIHGFHKDNINAYYARPLGAGPFPGVVLAHHMPGWDDWYREASLRFARHGYLALCPNLYFRAGHATPEDVAAKVRAAGGVSDDQAVGDLEGAALFLRSLSNCNSKVGIFGTCSGGRHAYLTACRTEAFDAIIDCWGGRVVMREDELTPNQPVPPIDYTSDLSIPLLGLFGEQDQSPSPDQVAIHEQKLKELGKDYEFHMYPNAGHGFFYDHRPAYRPEQAVDGWKKIWSFLKNNLS